jgi:hypothetical protein
MRHFAAPLRLLAVGLLSLALVGTGVALGAEEKPATSEKKSVEKKSDETMVKAPVVAKGGPPLCPAPAPQRAAVNTLEDMFGGGDITWLIKAKASTDEKKPILKTKNKTESETKSEKP